MDRVNTGVVMPFEMVERIANEPSLQGMTFPDAVCKLLNQQLQYLDDNHSVEAWVKRCMANVEKMPVGNQFTIKHVLIGAGSFSLRNLRLLSKALRDSPIVKLLEGEKSDVPVGNKGLMLPAHFERITAPEQKED